MQQGFCKTFDVWGVKNFLSLKIAILCRKKIYPFILIINFSIPKTADLPNYSSNSFYGSIRTPKKFYSQSLIKNPLEFSEYRLINFLETQWTLI